MDKIAAMSEDEIHNEQAELLKMLGMSGNFSVNVRYEF
jgi:hypothetical protein